MTQGLQVFNFDGSVQFSTTDRLARILVIEPWSSSAIAGGTWTTVLPTGLSNEVWGLLIPLFPLDNTQFYNATSGYVSTDTVGHPGQIAVQASKSTSYPYLLVYGVY